jgi:hypothetical protein
MKDFERAADILSALRIISRVEGRMKKRRRVLLAVLARPRTARRLLLVMETLPRRLRSRIPAALSLSQRSVVRAERIRRALHSADG